jgi:hypothetical protein
MAGDWVVWCKGFSRKREVLAIARRTGRDRQKVACTLMEFYEWADGETEDGFLPDLSVRNLSASQADTDDVFWQAVVAVGWLRVDEDGLRIPNFKRWMGCSAKRRLNDSNRKRQSRVDSVRNLSASDADKQRTECRQKRDQRREENREEKTPPNPPAGGADEGDGVNGKKKRRKARRLRPEDLPGFFREKLGHL